VMFQHDSVTVQVTVRSIRDPLSPHQLAQQSWTLSPDHGSDSDSPSSQPGRRRPDVRHPMLRCDDTECCRDD
jgi:hypothetical protein